MRLKNLVIVPEIRQKIEDRHQVREIEIHQCFNNRDGPYLADDLEEHQSASGEPTEWFVAETDKGRLLKIIFVYEFGNIYLKSAYTANATAIEDYEAAKGST